MARKTMTLRAEINGLKEQINNFYRKLDKLDKIDKAINDLQNIYSNLSPVTIDRLTNEIRQEVAQIRDRVVAIDDDMISREEYNEILDEHHENSRRLTDQTASIEYFKTLVAEIDARQRHQHEINRLVEENILNIRNQIEKQQKQ